jgi:hypothetical protein
MGVRFSKYVLLGAVFGMAAAGPVAAEDCFPKVRAAEARPATPPKAASGPRAHKKPAVRRPASQVRKPVGPKPQRVATAAKPSAPKKPLAESSFAMRTSMLPPAPSVECDTTPSIQAALPPEAKPPAQRLLDEIAGPPEELLPLPAVVPGGGPAPVVLIGGPGGGGPGGGPGGGGGGGRPPLPPPVSPVPEPGTWAMMIVGFFGLGSAVRASRRRAALMGRQA